MNILETIAGHNDNHQESMLIDYQIQAFVDDELDEKDRQTIWHRIKTRPYWRERYEKIKKQDDLLKLWWTHFKKDH